MAIFRIPGIKIGYSVYQGKDLYDREIILNTKVGNFELLISQLISTDKQNSAVTKVLKLQNNDVGRSANVFMCAHYVFQSNR